jgi:hypothetical protein
MNPRTRRRTTDTLGPMWVSNNRVLTGPKKPHARNPNFDAEETKILISLWGDPKIQKTLITTHKKQPVIAQIAEKMREFGYQRSTEEVNTRIKNLKCFYNRTKKELDSGEINMTLWRHYDAMDEIMTRPIFGNIGTQQEYQNIYDAKQQLNVERAEHQSNASESTNADDINVKEELHSDDEVDNSSVVMQLLEQAKLTSLNSQLQAAAASASELIVPKTEPVDEVDIDLEIAPKNNSTITNYSNAPNLSITSVVSNAKVGELKTPEQATASNPVAVTTSTTGTMPQSKISLVPANILMKPQNQQTQNLNFPQQKFILQNTNPTTSAANTTAGNPGMPMQLVFLKTPQTSTNNSTLIGTMASNTSNITTVNSTPTLYTTTTQSSRPPLPMLKPKPAPQQIQYTVQHNNSTNFHKQLNGLRTIAPQPPPAQSSANNLTRRDSAERNLLKKLDFDGGSGGPDGQKKAQGKYFFFCIIICLSICVCDAQL